MRCDIAITDVFRQGGTDLEELRRTVEDWEPRASILADSELENMIETVTVNV